MRDILAALEAGDRTAVLVGLCALSPAERRKLASRILELNRAWRTGDYRASPEAPNTLSWQFDAGTEEQRTASMAAVLSVATTAELVQESCMRFLQAQDILIAAESIRPTWLDPEGIDALVAAGKLRWSTVEALVAAGFFVRPESDVVIEAMVEELGFRSDRPLLDLLRSATGLVDSDLLYRLFEVEGGQQSSLAAADKYRVDQNRWSTALATLSESGELDRTRLLDGCLDALSRDFPAFRAGWYSRFHNRLEPTEIERANRSNAYLRLLSSMTPSTVSFALKIVEPLFTRGHIEPRELVSALGPALAARQKGTVKRAIKLLAKATAEAPELRYEAVTLAFDGLLLDDADVQTLALDFIQQHFPETGTRRAALQQRLEESADLLVPSLRSRVAASQVQSVCVGTPPAAASGLDPSLGVSDVAELEQGLEVVAFALEHDEDAVAQERALAVIAGNARPQEGWSELAGPLRKRARALYRNPRTGYEHPLRAALAYATLAWTERQRSAWNWARAPNDQRGFLFYFKRVDALVERVLADSSVLLLSTPTHRSGFIAPEVFHARFDAWRSQGQPLDPYDVVLALMRLPSDAIASARGRLGSEPAYDLAAASGRWGYDYSISSRISDGYTFHSIEVVPHEAVPDAFPTEQLWHVLRSPKLELGSALARWSALAMPRSLDAHFAAGVRHLGAWDMDEPGASSVHLEAARQPWVELGEAGHWLLLVSLCSRGTRAIELALDVAIDGVEQGRVDPDQLGAALATLLPSGMLKARRLAKQLGTVAHASPVHAAAVARAIAGGLRGAPEDAPRDVGALLSLLYELLVWTAGRLEDEDARAWLLSLTRGGQAGKTRKAILELGTSA